MLPNGLEYVVLRFALTCAGLVEVALNGAHRGPVLHGMLETAQPAAIVVAERFRDNLAGCGYPLDDLEVIGEASLAALCCSARAWAERPAIEPAPGETCRVIFTSGTTGTSKGAELSHAYEVFRGRGYAKAAAHA